MADEPDTLDDEELDRRYREIVDAFIDQANELSGHNSIENVGMALLFAASRFNAYVVSQHADSQEAFEIDMPKAKSFFGGQYMEMLGENLDDYKELYNRYNQFTKKS